MRRHASSHHPPYTKGHGNRPVPESVTHLRTFYSEANPTRPVRPSPLTRSSIRDMPLDLLERIRSFPLFQSAPESFLAAIGAHLRPQTHSPHDYILTEGDEARAMYWLVRGAIAVTSRDGESTYAELKPGAFFGEIGVLMGIPRTATIVARSKCLLMVLKKEDLAQELPHFPEVERAIREEAHERLSILERKKKENQLLRGKQRTPLASRGEKRLHEDDEGDYSMAGTNGIHAASSSARSGVSNPRKRKSPSPDVAVETSTALGSGLVHIRQLLKELPLFASLPSDMLHFLGSNAQQRTYPPFVDIIQQDSEGRDVYFIVRGEVEVLDVRGAARSRHRITNGAGRSVTTGMPVKARLREGQYFGEVTSLALAPRRTATVRTVTQVECLLITGQTLREFWKLCPSQICQQIEQTARQRLQTTDSDILMSEDHDTTTPAMGALDLNAPTARIRPQRSRPEKAEVLPKPNGIENAVITAAVDPDPFSNRGLEQVRRRTRRPASRTPTSKINGFVNPVSNGVTSSPAPTLRSRPKRARTLPPPSTQQSRGILPDPLLTAIFTLLDLHELIRLRRVSLHWSKLLRESPRLFRHLDLSLYNRVITDRIIQQSIGPFVGHRPRSIDISNCFHLTDEGFAGLAALCGEHVIAWRMKSVWDVSAIAIHDMIKASRHLQAIDLSNCRKVNDALLMHIIGNTPTVPPDASPVRRIAGRGPLSSPPTPPHATIPGSQSLKRLTLSYCKHVTDRSMAHIGTFARHRIEEIDLTRCTTITDHGFEAWGQQPFARLTKLCLADCTYLTDNAIVYLSNAARETLQYLDLSFCCALSDTAVEVLALGFAHLRYLDLSFCGSAVSDASLRSIGLHLLELRYLSVRGCVRVTGVGVEAVVEGCRLEAFDVSQCKNLMPWLHSGGLSRVRPGVKFKLVAGGW